MSWWYMNSISRQSRITVSILKEIIHREPLPALKESINKPINNAVGTAIRTLMTGADLEKASAFSAASAG